MDQRSRFEIENSHKSVVEQGEAWDECSTPARKRISEDRNGGSMSKLDGNQFIYFFYASFFSL